MSKKTISMFLMFFLILLNCQGRRLENIIDKQDELLKSEMLAKYYEYKEKDFPGIKDISVEDFLIMNDTLENIVLVDTRSKKEYDISIIPEAITMEQFERDKQLYTNYVVVSYCTIGARSGDYTEQLEKESFNAYNLIGGILAWAHAGKLFTKNGIETNKVHVFAQEWNYLPKDYIAVY